MIPSTEPFSVVVADPPWRFKDRLPGKGRGAAKHYATMATNDIAALALPPVAPDALLLLWRVAAMQPESLRVCEAWGFRPVAEIVWCKPRIGMGRYVRNAHETALIGVRGRATGLITSRSIPSWFAAPRTKHSTKPEAFYALVERLARGPYLELFARAERPGWTCIGDALGSKLERSAPITHADVLARLRDLEDALRARGLLNSRGARS